MNFKSIPISLWLSCPGQTIKDLMEEKNWTRNKLAKKLGITTTTLRELLKGEVRIKEELAKKLEEVLGPSIEFWLERERQYREELYKYSFRHCWFL